MVQKIYKDLDFGSVSVLRDAVLNTYQVDPTNPEPFVPWTNTTDGRIRYFNGKEVVTLAITAEIENPTVNNAKNIIVEGQLWGDSQVSYSSGRALVNIGGDTFRLSDNSDPDLAFVDCILETQGVGGESFRGIKLGSLTHSYYEKFQEGDILFLATNGELSDTAPQPNSDSYYLRVAKCEGNGKIFIDIKERIRL